MVGRPALIVGTHGRILTELVREKPKLYQSRARYRDSDGVTKFIRGQGSSIAASERNLDQRLTDRMKATTAIREGGRFDSVIAEWLVQIGEDDSLAEGTRRQYRITVRNHIRPQMGRLFLHEVTVQMINQRLRAIRDDSGLGTVKTARTCLTGILGVAVRTGALTANPAREAVSFKRGRKTGPRVLTDDQTDTLIDRARCDRFAVEQDLPDLIDWMLFFGPRIGEALAARYSVNASGQPLLDIDHRSWEINATVIRVGGVRRRQALETKPQRTWEEDEELRALLTLEPGLQIQERTKSDAGWRVLPMPEGAVSLLERRATEVRLRGPDGIVFGSPTARTLRDPSNTLAALRLFLDCLDCDHCRRTGYQLDVLGQPVLNAKGRKVRCRLGPWSWITSHTFRKTALTRLDEGGLTPRELADFAGHAHPSMTQDNYMGRQVVSAEAARLLDR